MNNHLLFTLLWLSFFGTASVQAQLNVSFVYDPAGEICPGEPITFLAMTDTSLAPSAFAWDFGDGTQATGDSVVHTYAETDTNSTYEVWLFVNAAPFYDHEHTTVTVNRQPSLAWVGDTLRSDTLSATTSPLFDVSLIVVDSLMLSPTDTLHWFWGDGSVSSSSNSTQIHTYQQFGTYPVEVYLNQEACPRIQTKIFNQPKLVGIDWDLDQTIVCEQETVTATITSYLPPGSFDFLIWDWADGHRDTMYTSDPVSHGYVDATLDTNIVSLWIKNPHGNLNQLYVSASQITVLPQPDLTVLAFDSVLCLGSPTMLSLAIDPGTTVTIDWGDGTPGSQLTHLYQEAGAYEITLTGINGMTTCQTSLSLSVEVLPPPTLLSIGKSMEFLCESDTVAFWVDTDSVGLANGSFYWDFGNGQFGAGATPTSPFYAQFGHDTTYQVVLLAMMEGCGDTLLHDSIFLRGKIKGPPQASNNCATQDSGKLKIQIPTSIGWSAVFDSTILEFSHLDSSYYYSYDSFGLHLIPYIWVDSLGLCPSQLDTLLVNIELNPDPDFLMYQDTTLISGPNFSVAQGVVEFSAVEVDLSYLYIWDTGDGGPVDTTSNPQYFHNYFNGTHHPSLTLVTPGGCKASKYVTLQVVQEVAKTAVTLEVQGVLIPNDSILVEVYNFDSQEYLENIGGVLETVGESRLSVLLPINQTYLLRVRSVNQSFVPTFVGGNYRLMTAHQVTPQEEEVYQVALVQLPVPTRGCRAELHPLTYFEERDYFFENEDGELVDWQYISASASQELLQVPNNASKVTVYAGLTLIWSEDIEPDCRTMTTTSELLISEFKIGHIKDGWHITSPVDLNECDISLLNMLGQKIPSIQLEIMADRKKGKIFHPSSMTTSVYVLELSIKKENQVRVKKRVKIHSN